MSNHAHIVLFIDPEEAQAWSDEEVARRWLAVFPGALRDAQSEEQKEYIELGLRSDPQRMKEIRSRLGSLSWFMRALNEPIARWANEEDGCSGRFWEGRFKSQALLEEQAVLTAMAYVDLNPVRAAMCDTLEESEYTSVQSRLKERSESGLSSTKLLGKALKPVAGLDAVALLGMTEASYIDQVQWTGEQAHPMKRGKLHKSKEPTADRPPEILWSLVKHPKQWTRQVHGTERLHYRAIGSAEALMATRLVRERPVARHVRVVQAVRSLTESTAGVAKATLRTIDRRERTECAALARRSRAGFLMRRVGQPTSVSAG